MTVGLKMDSGKLDYSLLDEDVEAEFIAVMMFGAEKYDRGNYVHVENPEDRYYAAIRRHARAFRKGEHFDPETGLHHLAAIKANASMLMTIVLRKYPSMVDSLPFRLGVALERARELRVERLKKAQPQEAQPGLSKSGKSRNLKRKLGQKRIRGRKET